MPDEQLNVVYMGEWNNTTEYPYNDNIAHSKVPLVQYNGAYYLALSQPAIGDVPGVAATWGLQSSGSGAATLPPLANANIFVGNATNVATAVPVTGDVTLANTGAVSLVNTSVTGQPLTGYTAGAGTVSATDTILTAIQKVDGNTQALTSLSSANILVGNATNVATSVPLSGDATIDNTGALTLNNASVIGEALTGYTAGAGTVSATDTILTAIQKVDGNTQTLSTLPNNNILVGNASNVATATPAEGYINGSVLTGYTAGAGTVSATDTIISAIQKVDGNNQATQTQLEASSTFTAGTGSPQINYLVDAIAGIVTYKIFDNVNFLTVGGGTTGPTAPVVYTLPQPTQGNVSNIIGVEAFLQTGFSPTGAGGGGVSCWASNVNNTNPSVSIVAFNTTSAGISDGTMWVTVTAKLV